MALNGAAGYPQACQALTSMLSRNALNPADISVLYRNYSALDPPPIDLIRTPQFLGKFQNSLEISNNNYRQFLKCSFVISELLVDALFKPGVKLNVEHRPKYVFLLAYAASVCETWPKKGVASSKLLIKEELTPTVKAVDKVSTICSTNKGSTELIAELSTLYDCIK